MKREDYVKYIASNFGNVDYLGFDYLIDCCLIYDKHKRNLCEAYSKIGKENGITAQQVERCIRFYISRMKDFDLLLSKLNGRRTVGAVINAIQFTVSQLNK